MNYVKLFSETASADKDVTVKFAPRFQELLRSLCKVSPSASVLPVNIQGKKKRSLCKVSVCMVIFTVSHCSIKLGLPV